jgi:hypothetical protein
MIAWLVVKKKKKDHLAAWVSFPDGPQPAPHVRIMLARLKSFRARVPGTTTIAEHFGQRKRPAIKRPSGQAWKITEKRRELFHAM